MFGLSFKDRVRAIIWEEFDYQYQHAPGVKAVFGQVCASAKESKTNEHSAAIMVMMVAMNSLGTDVDDPAMKKEVDNFIRTHTNNVLRIMHKADQPESDIKEMLLTILKAHNVDDEELHDIVEGKKYER